MRYGHFDEKNREYVIERPDTPKAWTNYLGDTKYGAVITNHGGGYSFYQSAAVGRLMRFRSNNAPDGMPGRLFYLRDQDDGRYWSATWQPVGNVKGFKDYECRHGTAYTTIKNVTHKIESNVTYFVPLGGAFEIWRMRLTNHSKRKRRIKLFSFCEFTSNWTLYQDIVNLQYTAYIVNTQFVDGPDKKGNRILRIAINDNLPVDPEIFSNGDQSRLTWMTLTGAPISGFDTERDAFLGPWNSYDRPRAVETGKLTGSLAYGDNAVGGLGSNLVLKPGETREVSVILGVGDIGKVAKPIVKAYSDPARIESELQKLKDHWHARLESLSVKTPDKAFDSMVNTWGIYNCLITFAWSRAASLVYNGERDGLGYRDTVQDILGVIAAVPGEARERLELMLTGQVASGGAMPVVKPFAHKPGKEPPVPEEEFRSDDCLWLFNTVPAYVAETGDFDFYKKVLPYADKGEATVFGHLRRALEFNLERTGKNNLPCGLSADWNDCLKLGYHGESIFVTFQVRYGLTVYADVARALGQEAEGKWALGERDKLDKHIQKSCWDGNWFRWAVGEDGTVYGTKNYPEGQVYLNTQVWAVISGAANPDQAKKSMKAVKDRLSTDYGLILCDPPFVKTKVDVMRAVLFNPGTKENAGIFSHPQSWAVMAECILGNGDLAYKYHTDYLPAAQNKKAHIRQIEPYVHCQSTHGKHSDNFGHSRLPWLTGAATWTYYSATQWILGLRPEFEGFRVDPCVPKKWKGFSAKRNLRGMKLNFEVKNPNRISKGVKSITVDGTAVSGNIIPWDVLKDGSKIAVVMG